VDAGSIYNVATATGTDPNDDPVTDEDDETVTAEQDPSLALTKSASPQTYAAAGDQIEYTFVVENDGNVSLTDVTVVDPLFGLSFGPVDLAPGESEVYTYTYTVTQADVDAGSIYNVATATGTDPNGEEVTDEDDEVVTLLYADLSLTKTVSVANPNVGDFVTFTIVVSNAGPNTATGVAFADYLPNGYGAITNISNGGVLAGNAITWSGFTIPVNGSVSVSFDAEVLAPLAGVSYVNYAEVTESDLYDPNSTPDNFTGTPLEDDEDSATVTPQVADLELTKSVSPSTQSVGGTVTFTIAVLNKGPNTATNVAIADYLPNGYSQIGNISNGGVLNGNTIEWSGFTINANSTLILTFTAVVLVPGDDVSYVNYAEVTASDQYDPDSTPDNFTGTPQEDDEDSAEINVDCQLEIAIGAPVCDDNGTPTDPSDDTFSFEVVVTGESTGSLGWETIINTSGLNQSFSGEYGVPTIMGPFPIDVVTPFGFTIWDVEQQSCRLLAAVTPPPACSDECAITSTVSNIICSDNGTPSNPTDDVFYFDILVDGANAGGGWRAIVGSDTIVLFYPFASFGYPATQLGPFPISAGSVTVLIQSVSNPSCGQLVTVQAPGTCSEQCGIAVELISTSCSDNGTSSNPNDDLFTATVNVTGFNAGSTWFSPTTGQSGSYGTEIVGPFPISGGPVTVIFTDSSVPGCVGSIVITPPPPCSNACSISAQAINIQCSNNGTPSNPNDDTFTFSLVVTGVNTGSGWVDVANGIMGNYGQPVIYGPYPIMGNNGVSITVRDAQDPNCVTTIVVQPPQSCSNNCAITANVSNLRCENNGTPGNPLDDVYYFDVIVSGFNTSGSWTAAGNTQQGPTQGAYNTVFTYGPYQPGTNVFIVFEDNGASACGYNLSVTIPNQACSNVCQISGTVQWISCWDNDTPYNGSDDQFFVFALINGFNTSGTWVSNTGASGTYGQEYAFGPFPISQGQVTITVTDSQNPGCSASFTAFAPAPCVSCDISVQVLGTQCNDNGTPFDPSDDTYTATVVVTGQGQLSALGWRYRQLPLGPLSTPKPYGVPTTVGPFPISGGNVNVRFTDVTNNACSEDVLLIAPPTCSNDCEIIASASSPVCDDNGTPFDPSDDIYSFELTVVGQGTGNSGWTALVNSVPYSGNYGNPVTVSGIPVGTNAVITNVRDAVKPNCMAESITVVSTEPCSAELPCDISVEYFGHECDNNGTAGNPSDDTYTFTVIVWNAGTGTSWTASNGTTGEYGIEVTFGPFSAADIGSLLNFTFTDDDDPDCVTELVVTTPNCTNQCNLIPVIQNVLCNDNGTPDDDSDDTFTFDLIVHGSYVGDTWTAIGTGITGTFGEPVTFGPYPIANGDITFSVVPDANPSCVLAVYVTAPPPCSNACGIEAEIFNITCHDNGTPDIASDDFFTFSALVTVDAPGTSWLAYDSDGMLINFGTFGVPKAINVPFPISGGDAQITFVNASDPTCTITVIVPAPPHCSPDSECQIITSIANVVCDDNGTPTDPSDDTYSFDLTVSAFNNVGSQWTALINGIIYLEDYGTITISGIPADTDALITGIQAADDPACTAADMTLLATGPCSDECVITASFANIVCDDNGTQGDSSDDTYSFELTVTALNNAGTQWTGTINGVSYTEAYGTITISGIPANTNLVIDGISAANDPSCTASAVTVPATGPCSDGCEIVASVANIVCDDNDTPLDPSDDTYSFELTVTALNNAGTQWTGTINGVSYTEAYGTITISGIPANTNLVIDGISAVSNPSCTAAPITVPATGPCSDQCAITASVANVICDNNGTPMDPSDDTYSFELTVTALNNAGSQWTAVINGVAYTENYGTITISGIPANTSLVISGISAVGNSSCTAASITVPATGPCSDQCAISAVYSNVICNDNGTPADSSDDTYSFELTVTALNNAGSQWTAVINGVVYTENYGTITISSIPANLNTVINGISVVGNPSCTAVDITVPATGPCSPGCALITVVSEITCDDNGTPDPTDDVFFFSLTVNAIGNINPGDTWVANFGGLSGEYNVAYVFGPYPIGIDLNFDIRNLGTADCTVNVNVESPLPCSEALIVECPLSTHVCPILGDIMLYPTGPFDCNADVEAPLPDVIAHCPDGQWSVVTQILEITDNGTVLVATIQPGAPRVIFGLGVGAYYFRYIVTDNCGNTVIKDCPFRVEDLSEPVAICFSGINVSLGGFGLARLYWHQINNGSYDNCGVDSIMVRRIYLRNPVTCDALAEPYFSTWGPFVDFTCCDAGSYVMVELRVVDIHGNSNICWLNVLVEDKTLPYCYGLENVTVGCDSIPAGFDPYNTLQLQALFGIPAVYDNCSAYAVELVPLVNLSDCGEGTIRRRFQAVDLVGNVSMAIFEQIVTIQGGAGYDIYFPADAYLACDTVNADTVRVYYSGCDSITVVHVDTLLQAEGAECFRIQRTYTVTNWCEYDGISDPIVISRNENCDTLEGEQAVWVLNRRDSIFIDADSLYYNNWPLAGVKDTICDGTTNPSGYWRLSLSVGAWQYTQLLYVYDTVPPVIAFVEPDPFCSTESDSCLAEVLLAFEVFDYCSGDSLSFRVMLDEGYDGELDREVTDEVEIAGAYPYFTLTGIFPIGTHALQMEVTDGCRNTGAEHLPFEVVDCFIADPDIYDGLILSLMPLPPGTDIDGDGEFDEAGMVVHLSFLLEDTIVDCSNPVRYSINKAGQEVDVNNQSIILTCMDPNRVMVEVHAWDNANNPYLMQADSTMGGPNHSMSLVPITIQNSNGICDPGFDNPGLGRTSREPVLYQNEPNPFTGNTKVRFWLPERQQVEFTVQNVAGQLVKKLEGVYEAGLHEIEILRADLGNYGLYYYRLNTGKFLAVKPMIMLE
jgi:uncharacterized repeat protein (TIGR01451 family)